MADVTFHLEVVTPLFMGGADPRGDPEFRSASLRGEARAWWRALWGGVNPDASIEQLFAAESRVFGDTTQASPVVIAVTGGAGSPYRWGFGKDTTSGVDYLMFSMKGRAGVPDRAAIAPGQKFAVRLSARPGAAHGETAVREACAALWAMTRFGGLGARSRRGAGCTRVVAVENWPVELPDPVITATSPGAYAQECSLGLQTLYRGLGWSAPVQKLKAMPGFNILHAQAAPLYVLGKGWSSWQSALHEVGDRYRAFRSRRRPDYDSVKDVISGRTRQLGVVGRASFGLPIVFYYRSLGGERGTLETSEEGDRRASPLTFHVVRLADGRYGISFIRFNAQFLPRGGLRVRGRGGSATGDAPNMALITQFLRAIGEKGFVDEQAGDLHIAPMLAVHYPGSESAK